MKWFFQDSELAGTLALFRREFVVCLVFTVAINVLMLTPTLYMMQVFDRVFISQSELTLVALTIVMLFLFALLAFIEWSRSRLLVRTGIKFDSRLNSRIFNASFEAELERAGVNRVQPFTDLTNIRQFLTGYGLFAFLDAPWTPIYIAVLFLLHPALGWLSIVFCLASIGLAYLSQRWTRAPLEKASAAGMEVGIYVQSKLKNVEVIEAMGMLGDLRRRWLSRHRQHLTQQQKAQDLSQRLQSASKFLRYTQNSLALAAGALLVIEGELTAGGIIAANMLMNRAIQPVDLMVAQWKSFLSACSSFRRLQHLLQSYPPRRAGVVQAVPRGQLRLEHLTATAPGRAEPILHDLNADFQPGEIVVVIGPSGAGKSTLARCLVGIWPQANGRVWLDGEPIDSWDRQELGPFVGFLPQDIELFDGSIAENIARFGDIDSNKIIAACQRAGVHEMILRLPRGYDTPIGEAGNLLSGGQRQRIALARAMYGDPAIIVLDEPNSNLDEVGEAALIKAVQELRGQGKTVLLISHRRNVMAVADRILLINEGAIAFYGPAAEFIAAMNARREPSAMNPDLAAQSA